MNDKTLRGLFAIAPAMVRYLVWGKNRSLFRYEYCYLVFRSEI